MITRRELLERSGAALGLILGAEKLIFLADGWAGDGSGPLSVRTRLKMIDAAEITALMRDLDEFGGKSDLLDRSKSYFKKGMDLSDFVRRCYGDIRKRHPLPHPGKKLGPREMVRLARNCGEMIQLHLALLNVLSESGFLLLCRQQRYALPYATLWKGVEEMKTVYRLFLELGEGMKKEGYPLTILSQKEADHNPLINLRLQDRLRIDLKAPITGPLQRVQIHHLESQVDNIWSAIRLAGTLESIRFSFRHSLFWWKQEYSKYALFSSHEKYLGKIGRGREALSGKGVVTQGAGQFLAKSLLHCLFLELSLNRMKILASECRSSVFTNSDRGLLNMEFWGLMDLMDLLGSNTLFAGKPLNGPGQTGRYRIKLGKTTVEANPGALTTRALGMRPGGYPALTVSTVSGSHRALVSIEEALRVVGKERDKLNGGTERP